MKRSSNDNKAIHGSTPTAGYPPPPRFFQRDGKLHILHANENVQGRRKRELVFVVVDFIGLYACVDEKEQGHIGHAFLLLARMPLTGITWPKKEDRDYYSQYGRISKRFELFHWVI